jgi:hypothetical protein
MRFKGNLCLFTPKDCIINPDLINNLDLAVNDNHYLDTKINHIDRRLNDIVYKNSHKQGIENLAKAYAIAKAAQMLISSRQATKSKMSMDAALKCLEIAQNYRKQAAGL